MKGESVPTALLSAALAMTNYKGNSAMSSMINALEAMSLCGREQAGAVRALTTCALLNAGVGDDRQALTLTMLAVAIVELLLLQHSGSECQAEREPEPDLSPVARSLVGRALEHEVIEQYGDLADGLLVAQLLIGNEPTRRWPTISSKPLLPDTWFLRRVVRSFECRRVDSGSRSTSNVRQPSTCEAPIHSRHGNRDLSWSLSISRLPFHQQGA